MIRTSSMSESIPPAQSKFAKLTETSYLKIRRDTEAIYGGYGTTLEEVMRSYQPQPITPNSRLAENVKKMVAGKLKAKYAPRPAFPKRTPKIEEFKDQSLDDCRRLYECSISNSDGSENPPSVCYYYIPAEPSAGLRSNILLYVFDRCGLSNMGENKVSFPVFYGGKKSTDMPCVEQGFQIMKSVYCKNGEEVIENIYGAQTVQEVKKAGNSAQDFEIERWDQDSLQIMCSLVVHSLKDSDGNNFETIVGLVELAEKLKEKYGDFLRKTEILVAEAPKFKDNIWGIGTNTEGVRDTVYTMVKEGRTCEILDTFSSLLKPEDLTRTKTNCFSQYGKNQLGQIFTVVVGMIQEWSKEIDEKKDHFSLSDFISLKYFEFLEHILSIQSGLMVIGQILPIDVPENMVYKFFEIGVGLNSLSEGIRRISLLEIPKDLSNTTEKLSEEIKSLSTSCNKYRHEVAMHDNRTNLVNMTELKLKWEGLEKELVDLKDMLKYLGLTLDAKCEEGKLDESESVPNMKELLEVNVPKLTSDINVQYYRLMSTDINEEAISAEFDRPCSVMPVNTEIGPVDMVVEMGAATSSSQSVSGGLPLFLDTSCGRLFAQGAATPSTPSESGIQESAERTFSQQSTSSE